MDEDLNRAYVKRCTHLLFREFFEDKKSADLRRDHYGITWLKVQYDLRGAHTFKTPLRGLGEVNLPVDTGGPLPYCDSDMFSRKDGSVDQGLLAMLHSIARYRSARTYALLNKEEGKGVTLSFDYRIREFKPETGLDPLVLAMSPSGVELFADIYGGLPFPRFLTNHLKPDSFFQRVIPSLFRKSLFDVGLSNDLDDIMIARASKFKPEDHPDEKGKLFYPLNLGPFGLEFSLDMGEMFEGGSKLHGE